jgi:hypothetical protein
MNFYTGVHAFYCGVDLHARSMYLCILDDRGQHLGPLAHQAAMRFYTGQHTYYCGVDL